MQKLEQQLLEMQKIIRENEKEINELEEKEKQLLREEAQERNQREDLDRQLEEVFDDLLKNLEKENQEMEEAGNIINQNINTFKLAQQYAAEVSSLQDSFDFNFVIKGAKQIQEMEDQDQKLEKAERLMEEKIKYYEDEEYKLRIRTTLTEIELKEMKEMQKRK